MERLPGTNALAYFASSTVMDKSFITLATDKFWCWLDWIVNSYGKVRN
jgi:hypothetical protein